MLLQGVPFLRSQNQFVLKKLFAVIADELDVKTGRLPFVSFCSAVQILQADDIDQKVLHFANQLEPNHQVTFCQSELVSFIRKSFESLKTEEDRSRDFFDRLSEYLTKFIFEKA